MKKIYLEPEVEIVNFKMRGFLCISNGAAEGGDGDGGTTTQEGDPTNPDWGSDY